MNKKLHLAIIGSREANNEKQMINFIWDRFDDEINSGELVIVSGGAFGADRFGRNFAERNNIELIEYLPDWNRFGKSAGFKRNIQIIDKADIVLALWNGISKGTKHSLNLAAKQKKPTIILYF